MSVRLELAIGSGVTNGGTIATGMLQLAAGIPLDTTLRSVTDQANTVSPLQLSTTTIGALENIFFQAEYKNIGRDGNNAVRFATGEIRLSVGSSGNIIFYDAGTATNFLTANKNGVAIGHTTASARLHVRGDGTNPIARFESSAGGDAFEFKQTSSFKIGTLNNYIWMSTAGGGNPVATGEMLEFFSDATNQSNPNFKFRSSNSRTNTAGTASILQIGDTSFIAAAGSANFRPLNIAYTINNSGAQSGTATGIFLNATETALNGMTHNLFDLQIANVSIFKGTRAGLFTSGVNKNLTFAADGNVSVTSFTLRHSSNEYGYADIQLTAAVSNQFNRFEIGIAGTNILRVSSNQLVQFGGFTNAFPAIKRNGAEIQFKLADDSAMTRIQCSQLITTNGLFLIASTALTNGAGASTGTITNAPAVGNPTKWIPIDDAGVTRYIPCW